MVSPPPLMRVRLACVAMQFAEGSGCCRRTFVLVGIGHWVDAKSFHSVGVGKICA
jgi:hypothetical protein